MAPAHRIDCLQYAAWSPRIFEEMAAGGLHAVHATVAYHENFRETVARLEEWNRFFARNPERILRGRDAADVRRARETGRTAIFFGAQNCSPIEDDLGLVEVCRDLGLRFMQLTYNNQSPLAAGYLEERDCGVTRFGREVIAEMNRVGLVVDMSHSGERSTLEAIEISERPVAITHANPARWRETPRNKSEEVIAALAAGGGVMGFSLYPHHMKDGGACRLDDFCRMVAETVERHGAESFGIGSDLCQGHGGDVLAWMRDGRWRFGKNDGGGKGDSDSAEFPPQPEWFRTNADFPNLAEGLRKVGFNDSETDALLGENWLRFFESSFTPRDE